jgi:hypothetical protein
MAIDQLKQISRSERRSRRVPVGRRCDECDARNHLIASRRGEVLCDMCRRKRLGTDPYEADHIAGRTHLGAITVDLSQNDHRTITELREVLGMDAWPAPDSSLEAALAHFLGNLAVLLWLVAEWWLEHLAGGGGAAASAVP